MPIGSFLIVNIAIYVFLVVKISEFPELRIIQRKIIIARIKEEGILLRGATPDG
jgi:hypothetical protein